MSVHGDVRKQDAYIVSAGGSVFLFSKQEVDESCARCRAIDRESWNVYKSLPTDDDETARAILGILAKEDDLEDPSCIERFGEPTRILSVTSKCSIGTIDHATGTHLSEAIEYAKLLIKHHIK